MRRSLTTVVAVAVALVLSSGPVAGQSGVSASTDRGSVRSGEEVRVTGDGWPADSRVQASICGNQARALSADCDLPSSRTIVTDEDGRFSVPLDVAVPPSPCPCVVFVSGQNTASTVRFPIEVLDAPAAPTTTPDVRPRRDFEVLGSFLAGSGPWTAWFGGAAERDLVLDIENTGTIEASPNLSVTWGSGANPTHVVEVPTLETIAPGETARYRVPVRFDAFSIGSMTVAGSVTGSSGPIAFSTSTSTYPWALLALAIVALQLVLLAVRNRVRNRLHRDEPAPTDEGIDAEDLERALALAPGSVAALPPAEIERPPDVEAPQHVALTSAVATDAPEVESPEPITVADPYEADTARAVAASSALAARLRRETDVALMDHHEQAVELAANLRRDAAEQSALLLSSVRDAHDQLTTTISSTREQAHEAAQVAADEAAELVREARAHRDAARAVLDEAAAHAHLVIGAAEMQAVRFEEIEQQWQTEAEAVAERHRAQLEELERLESRLQEVRGSLEGRAMAISEDADLRSELLIEHAASTETELRDEAHQALVDIVMRSAQVSAAQVFAASTPPEPTLDPRPERATAATPAHLADSGRKARFWRRRTRAASAHRSET